MRNLIIAGVILILVAVLGYFAWTRISTRLSDQANNPADSRPLNETPEPTLYPFGTSTPFPLITFGSPTSSPRSTSTPRGSATATPTAQCLYLTADPSTGSAPLTVKFTATGLATSGTNRTYEFDFGEGTPVKQNTITTTHKYEKVGTFNATLKVIDSNGNTVNLGSNECRRTITVKGVPAATSGGNSSTLPNTGPEDLIYLLLAPVTILGVYLYRRFRLL